MTIRVYNTLWILVLVVYVWVAIAIPFDFLSVITSKFNCLRTVQINEPLNFPNIRGRVPTFYEPPLRRFQFTTLVFFGPSNLRLSEFVTLLVYDFSSLRPSKFMALRTSDIIRPAVTMGRFRVRATKLTNLMHTQIYNALWFVMLIVYVCLTIVTYGNFLTIVASKFKCLRIVQVCEPLFFTKCHSSCPNMLRPSKFTTFSVCVPSILWPVQFASLRVYYPPSLRLSKFATFQIYGPPNLRHQEF